MKPDELIDALGGSAEVAELLGVESNAVGNWRKRGLPAWTHVRLSKLCEDRGIEPGDALDAQPPRRERAA